MTAILNEIRGLDEKLERGDLTREQYAARRAALLQSVEVAETDFVETSAPVWAKPQRTGGTSALGFGLVVCLCVMGLSIGLTLLFLPDLNLALTLGVTILAALSVALLRDIEK
ncbi:SHOCT domain-containing protein [Roseobacter weihaiensis]|uniref:SHOCT domain-containing protein n=1 Tax=Roseobacter weihaiensis TaxID=2763262 RepID=UPI001D09BC28|nr:SHOCT domain-containing protein [Roseobacter sp. H9]